MLYVANGLKLLWSSKILRFIVLAKPKNLEGRSKLLSPNLSGFYESKSQTSMYRCHMYRYQLNKLLLVSRHKTDHRTAFDF